MSDGYGTFGLPGGASNPLNPFARDFDRLTIGTPINIDRNEIIHDTQAFDIDRLIQSGLLVPPPDDADTVSTHLIAAGDETRSQETWGSSTSASLGLQSAIIDLAASFYVTRTENTYKRVKGATITGVCHAETSTYLIKGAPDEYFDCTTPVFKLYIKAVEDAAKAAGAVGATEADKRNLVKALNDFYLQFGTGCVSALDLVAYGAFEATLRSNSHGKEEMFGTGGGIAVSLPLIGGKAASDFVSTKLTQDANCHFDVLDFGRPQNSSPALWASNAAQALRTTAVQNAVTVEFWEKTAPATVPAPERPVLQYQPKPMEGAKLPSFADILAVAIKALTGQALGLGDAANLFLTEGREGLEEKTNGALAKLRAEAETSELKINQKATPGKIAPKEVSAAPSAPLARANVSLAATGSQPAPGDGGPVSQPVANNLLLKGYRVGGYSYKPWSWMFPVLDLGAALTEFQVIFGQALIWFSIRGVFAQYLDFCSNFSGVVVNKNGNPIDIRNEAGSFRTALEETGKELIKRLTDSSRDLDDGFLQEMEEYLQGQLHYFSMVKHYRFWIENYGWLRKAPFGAVAVVEFGQEENGEPRYAYQQNPDHCPILDGDSPDGPPTAKGYLEVDADGISAKTLLTNNAYRLYPIISTTHDGNPHFVWVGAPSRMTGKNTHPEAVRRFSGLLSFTPDPTKHKSYRPDEAVAPFDPRRIPRGEDFNETVLPMLVHQSAAAATEIREAEVENNWQYGCGGTPAERLQERWNNRKAMFGMNLYPGVGQDDDGFGPAKTLLETAGTLAWAASEHATVLPAKKPPAAAGNTVEEDEYDDYLWDLEEPKGAVAAYSADHGALFFWGPTAGPGWDIPTRDGKKRLFEPHAVKLVPIGYLAANTAVTTRNPADESDTDEAATPSAPPWMTSGGAAMWLEPPTDMMTELHKFAPKHDKPKS